MQKSRLSWVDITAIIVACLVVLFGVVVAIAGIIHRRRLERQEKGRGLIESKESDVELIHLQTEIPYVALDDGK